MRQFRHDWQEPLPLESLVLHGALKYRDTVHLLFIAKPLQKVRIIVHLGKLRRRTFWVKREPPIRKLFILREVLYFFALPNAQKDTENCGVVSQYQLRVYWRMFGLKDFTEDTAQPAAAVVREIRLDRLQWHKRGLLVRRQV